MNNNEINLQHIQQLGTEFNITPLENEEPHTFAGRVYTKIEEQINFAQKELQELQAPPPLDNKQDRISELQGKISYWTNIITQKGVSPEKIKEESNILEIMVLRGNETRLKDMLVVLKKQGGAQEIKDIIGKQLKEIQSKLSKLEQSSPKIVEKATIRQAQGAKIIKEAQARMAAMKTGAIAPKLTKEEGVKEKHSEYDFDSNMGHAEATTEEKGTKEAPESSKAKRAHSARTSNPATETIREQMRSEQESMREKHKATAKRDRKIILHETLDNEQQANETKSEN